MKGSVLRYLGAGTFTSLLDFVLFAALVNLTSIHYVLANVISTLVTICVSYLINRRLVFRSRTRSIWGFVAFLSATLFTGMVLQAVVIWAVSASLTPLLPWASDGTVKSIAKIIAMAVGAVVNYLSYRWIFSPRPREEPTHA